MSRVFVVLSGCYSDASADLVRVPDEMAHAYRSLWRNAEYIADFDEAGSTLRQEPADWFLYWPDGERLKLDALSPLHARILVCVLAMSQNYSAERTREDDRFVTGLFAIASREPEPPKPQAWWRGNDMVTSDGAVVGSVSHDHRDGASSVTIGGATTRLGFVAWRVAQETVEAAARAMGLEVLP